MYETLAVLGGSAIFAFLYTQEKDFIYKYLFLFASLVMLALSYSVESNTLLVPFTSSLGVFVLGLMIYWIYKSIKALTTGATPR